MNIVTLVIRLAHRFLRNPAAPCCSPGEKFLEILKRFGIPTDLEHQTVVMHTGFALGYPRRNTVTFSGVGVSIPEEIRTAIENEVIPLLRQQIVRWDEIAFSDEVMEPGEPARRQADWNAFAWGNILATE